MIEKIKLSKEFFDPDDNDQMWCWCGCREGEAMDLTHFFFYFEKNY